MSTKGKKYKHHHHHQSHQQQQPELSTSDQQKLPTKLQNIFDKQVLTEYENENYRECIKQCDRILRDYPKNGETLAMKGLCLHCQGQGISNKDNNDDDDNNNRNGDGGDDDDDEEEREEKLKQNGLQLIDEGLRYNLKSSICWRVKGLAHSKDKEFETAIICYRKSSFYDKQNQRILTDLSSLQIQLKKFDEFVKTRYELWLLNQDKLNCCAYFIALYLNKQYEQCLTFINENIDNKSNKFKLNSDLVELNEIYLLQTNILLKQEKYQKCLEFLIEKLNKKEIVDKLKGLQIKLNIEIKLKKYDDATKTALNLIDENPENLNYHNQYKELLLLENQNIDYFVIYQKLQEQYPKCKTIKRILLECCNDEKEFEILLNKYLINGFKRSVMSLYNDIRNLYEDKSKEIIINKLIDLYRSELSINYRFNKNEEKYSSSPMCLLWVNYFYCSHLIDTNNFELSLKILNETIEIVPTCIELYVLKAKLYKHIGNRLLAFKYLNIARKLDKADRYLNTKCVRYAFRAFKNDDAEKMVTLFLKKTEGTASLHNLQVIWYQLNKAESHLKLKQYGPALKQYENIFFHFETFWKNQTDFHRYSYRKCAIHSYLQLLDWEYNLRNHPIFIQSAKKAINLWILIYKLQKTNHHKQLSFGCSKQTDLDKKLHRQKDERGWKLIKCKSPLKKAKKWLNYLLPLIEHISSDDDDYQNIIYIYSLNIKYLFYIRDYKQLIENITIIKEQYKQFLHHQYFIYTMYQILYDDDGNNDDDINKLKQEYNTKFLKSYYEGNLNDFNKLFVVLKLCLEIKQIEENIEISLSDIIESMIKLECSALQCVEVREELLNHTKTTSLSKFEKYVETKYPMQLTIESDGK